MEHAHVVERERETESQAFSPLSAEPDSWLDLTT